MTREFGLIGVVVTVVGYVIGAFIFISPGQLAGSVVYHDQGSGALQASKVYTQ